MKRTRNSAFQHNYICGGVSLDIKPWRANLDRENNQAVGSSQQTRELLPIGRIKS